MAFATLENIINKSKFLAISALASLSLSCGSCGKDELYQVSYDPTAAEICNNGLDDNGNGIFDELCDEDHDGYCSNRTGMEIVYRPEAEPSVCPGTFKNCPPGEICAIESFLKDCMDDPAYFRPECSSLPADVSMIDCSKYSFCAPCIYPGATEYCDNQDNDCNKISDNDFIEKGRLCGEDLGNNFELDGMGICRAGIYLECIDGQLSCVGARGPEEKERCNGVDDTCRRESENLLTEAEDHPCYYEFRPDQFGNAIKYDLGIYHRSIGQGECQRGFELCVDGVSGGDGICHGAVLPQSETEQNCDCRDDNCNGETDEGLHSELRQEFAFVIDTSCSMESKLGYIKNALSSLDLGPCSDNEQLKASTLILGERTRDEENPHPLLRRSLISLREFSLRIEPDIPSRDGPGNEPNLNSIVNIACAVLEQQAQEAANAGQYLEVPPACLLISPYNSLKPDGTANQYNQFNSLNQPVFSLNSNKYIILFSDEQAQWVNLSFNQRTETWDANFPALNQSDAAQLASQARIKVIIFTEPYLDSYTINDPNAQGYGYFKEDGGEIRNINEYANLRQTIEEIIITKYCQRE